MGDIVNLRQVRKAKARVDRERLADANRAKFGRTKGERLAQSAEEERAARLLEGSRRNGDPEPRQDEQ